MLRGPAPARRSHRPRRGTEYLGQVARTAEQLGFTGVLTPTGTWCEDAWLTTAALIRETSRLKFLVAFRPGAVSPTLAAQMAATFQRLSAGLLLLNVVTGGDAVEQQRFGDWLDHDERYDRTDEFILSGHPHVEEVFWFGEHVIPRLRRAGIVAGEEPSTLRRPFALTMSAAR